MRRSWGTRWVGAAGARPWYLIECALHRCSCEFSACRCLLCPQNDGEADEDAEQAWADEDDVPAGGGTYNLAATAHEAARPATRACWVPECGRGTLAWR
jgi:hypothetical protein